jgi:hypothetical protein
LNKEELKEYQRKYRLEHLKELKERNKKYRLENAEKIKNRKREYQLEHPEQNRINSQTYYYKNRELIIKRRMERVRKTQKNHHLTTDEVLKIYYDNPNDSWEDLAKKFKRSVQHTKTMIGGGSYEGVS